MSTMFDVGSHRRAWQLGGPGFVWTGDRDSFDADRSWYRSYGDENWDFDDDGLMRMRIASSNDLPIKVSDPSITGRWAVRRDYASLSALGL